MPILTFTPPIPPSPGTRNRPEVKILKAEFGDGYTQEAGDGINNVRAVVSLSWDTLTPAQADQIEAFFEARKGYERFYYRLQPGKPLLKWTCPEWERAYSTPDKISATFRRQFDLGT